MAPPTQHNSLSAATNDRKARLAQLRNLKRKHPAEEEVAASEPQPSSPKPENAGEADVSRLHLSGRNFDFETRGPKLGFDHSPNVGLDKPTLEEQAEEVVTEVRKQAAEEEQDDKGIDLFKLQPKKANWDLKRNLEKKMDILKVRTDNAIARLVRQRISGSQKATQKGEAAPRKTTEGEAGELDGAALVEGLRVREREDQEEERREREEDESIA